nr:TonB-dependent receptor [Sphingomonas sp. CDS-1]
MNQNKRRAYLAASTAWLTVLAAPEAYAQAHAPAAEASNDIIVTARKREESDLAVPVAITAVGAEEIQNRAINRLDYLTQSVPGLQIGESGGSIQGGTIVLRGIGAGEDNPFADQAVSFNIDGAQIARSSVQRMANMDIAGVQVLKGPQALFFGKNSPGGVISITTADPTPDWQAKISGAYEINAQEERLEGYVSGPLTDTLGIRIAGYGSHIRGWIRNVTPETSSLAPKRRWLPHDREIAGRLTLKFEPSDEFNARLKVTHNRLKGSGQGPNDQFVYCPLGAPQLADADDCRADDRVIRPDLGTAVAATDPAFGDGSPYSRQNQTLASLEMNYDLTDDLTLTSVTSRYQLHFDAVDEFSKTSVDALSIGSHNRFKVKETSQELRLASDFDFPVNFTIGGFYQDSKVFAATNSYAGTLAPFFFNQTAAHQDGTSYSVFGQLNWKPVEQLELSGGGRWSHERKRVTFDILGTPVPVLQPQDQWHDFSPEISATYRPSQDLTFFASYRRGFLSGGFNGGFNAGSGTSGTQKLSFDQQKVRGFEGGIKAVLLDRMLRLNLTAYSYDILGQQVTTSELSQGNIAQITTNAGKSRTQGAELEATLRAPIEGFSLSAAAAYTHARYKVFTTQCYRGQTIAEECNLALIGGAYTLQSLAGEQIVRSPDWTGHAGANYEAPLGDALRLGLSADVTYSSGFYTNAVNAPGTRQDGYWLLDASARLMSGDERWELGMIGRNLTNKYYFSKSYEGIYSGSTPGTAGPLLPADVVGSVSRGRQILLRLSYKMGG